MCSTAEQACLSLLADNPENCDAGVVPKLLQSPANSSVLQFTQANITFHNTEILGVDAWDFTYILCINGSNNTIVGLVTDGCSAQNATLLLDGAHQTSYDATTIANSIFRNSTTQGLSIQYCQTSIINSSFDSLIHSSNNGGAFSVFNSDGSGVRISGCNFTNNAAKQHG